MNRWSKSGTFLYTQGLHTKWHLAVKHGTISMETKIEPVSRDVQLPSLRGICNPKKDDKKCQKILIDF